MKKVFASIMVSLALFCSSSLLASGPGTPVEPPDDCGGGALAVLILGAAVTGVEFMRRRMAR